MAGAILVAIPVASVLGFLIAVALRVYADVQRYRPLGLQADITLDETAGLVALVGLATACVIAGVALIRRSRETGSRIPRVVP